MGRIYSNAFLTLAAASAADPSAGFFGDSDAHMRAWEYTGVTTLRPMASLFGLTDSGDPYLYNMFIVGVWDRVDSHPGDVCTGDNREAWPLLRRAWAFQERMLSPRVIYIGNPEMRWECKERRSCECEESSAASSKIRLASFQRTGGSSSELRQLRHDLIEAYSALSLTYDEDKLPAFSGLAKQVCQVADYSDYLAGLFRDSLEVDLLWIADSPDPDSGLKVGRSDRAPTWSWASVHSGISFPLSSSHFSAEDDRGRGFIEEVYFQVNNAHCPAKTSDPTGQVAGGLLSLSGSAFDCNLRDGRICLQGCSRSLRGMLHLDVPRLKSGSSSDASLRSELESDSDGDFGLAIDGIPGPSVQVLCLRSTRFRRFRTSISELWVGEYSLVLQVVDPPTNTYRRLGVFTQQIMGQRGENPPTVRESHFESGGRQETVLVV
jgi:hypothetical protein